MTSENNTQKSFGKQVGSFFRVVLRVLFTILLAIGVGVGVYYGVAYGIPALRSKYIQPVKDNTQRLNDLEAQQKQGQEQLSDNLEDLRGRLENLEMQNDIDKETLANLQSQLAALREEGSALQTTVQENQEHGKEGDAELREALATLAEQQQQLQADIGLLFESQVPVTDLQNELATVKVMELLTRAQQSLLHNNYGLAEDDLLAAQEQLTQLLSKASDAQIEHLSTIIQHLEAASAQLPENANLASKEIEIVWQLLVAGPEEAEGGEGAEESEEAEEADDGG